MELKVRARLTRLFKQMTKWTCFLKLQSNIESLREEKKKKKRQKNTRKRCAAKILGKCRLGRMLYLVL